MKGLDELDRPKRRPAENLTPREREIIALVGTGANNGEIAQELRISVRTVKNHMYAIFTKVGCQNRTCLALWALEQKAI